MIKVTVTALTRSHESPSRSFICTWRPNFEPSIRLHRINVVFPVSGIALEPLKPSRNAWSLQREHWKSFTSAYNTVGALLVRNRFWGILYSNCIEAPWGTILVIIQAPVVLNLTRTWASLSAAKRRMIQSRAGTGRFCVFRCWFGNQKRTLNHKPLNPKILHPIPQPWTSCSRLKRFWFGI